MSLAEESGRAGREEGGDPLAHCRAVVERSGTSFTLGMKVLPRARREGMYALYAFCREVDDIADEGGAEAWKRAELAAWRAEIDRLYQGRPSRPTTRALAGPVAAWDLPRAEFLAIIDGMEMDAGAPIVAPDAATLRLYCRRVAGAVGLVSIRIFGTGGPAAEGFALALGEALQLTNILRDVDEDADRGRLYVPRPHLEAAGVEGETVAEILAHPAFPAACRLTARDARARFAEADRFLADADRRALAPALLMMGLYETVLARLERGGWEAGRRLERPGRLAKLWGALWRGLGRGLLGVPGRAAPSAGAGAAP